MRSFVGDFPVLKRRINGKRIVYLDSAASSLKPRAVIDALTNYYSNISANVFRGIYNLSEKATKEYETAREKVAKFINAHSSNEIIFTRSATESINLAAYSWGRLNINKGDEIATTIMEHHSNFVPWQQLAIENGGVLKIIDIDEIGHLDLKDKKLKAQSSKLKSARKKLKLGNIVSKRTKLLAITHVSNVLGTINPIKEITKAVKEINPNCLVLVDGAQAVPHLKVDVQSLGCDFYAFSGHKMLGPTGIGVLWAKSEILGNLAPFNFGGSMISKVSVETSKFSQPPQKFEAGTPHIAGAIGLGAAVDYLSNIGMDEVREHEVELTEYALERLGEVEGIKIYGPESAKDRGGVVAFSIYTKKGKLIHPHDVAQILNENNICVRAGHHCAMPLHKRLKITASVRASFYLYNTREDVDMLVEGVGRVISKLGQD
jgi:cysteine desulfurase/selenocysteine lyase